MQIRPDPAPHQIQVTSIQWQADNNKAKQILEQIQQLISNQDQQIDSIRQMQQQLIVHGELEGLRQLADQQFKLLQQIEIELKELHHLNKTIVLDHSNLHATRVHAIRLQMQQQRIELLRQELQHHSTPGAPPKLYASSFFFASFSFSFSHFLYVFLPFFGVQFAAEWSCNISTGFGLLQRPQLSIRPYRVCSL